MCTVREAESDQHTTLLATSGPGVARSSPVHGSGYTFIFASRSRPNYTTYELTRTCTWIRLGMDGDPGAGESLRELALEKLCTYCVGNVDNRQRGGIGEAYTRSGVYRQSHTYERRAPKRRAPRGSGVHKGEGSREERGRGRRWPLGARAISSPVLESGTRIGRLAAGVKYWTGNRAHIRVVPVRAVRWVHRPQRRNTYVFIARGKVKTQAFSNRVRRLDKPESGYCLH
ncbi:hypothetical protein B0H13DRAFT_1899752 [Mycena leptocephala]|nr:hypothetical protein B0H13DRAFT_1899752 [Mycena leptocephala]